MSGVPTRAQNAADTPILEVCNLALTIRSRRGTADAVRGISFTLARGETLGLVGESGSGKSLTALAVMGLLPKPAVQVRCGKIIFDGRDLVPVRDEELRRIRGRHIALVLQDPMTALNPVLSIREQIFETLRIHHGLRGRALTDRAIELLSLLQIPDPERRLRDFPHQFSGGMRQRVVGAIALSCGPDVLIADEPTTSLDVTAQASYLAQLRRIQQESALAILFITHDFGVVSRICDRVAVMYAGEIVESARVTELFEHPAHPYTTALLAAIPDPQAGDGRLSVISGQPPSPFTISAGCAFAPRCPFAMERCRRESPPETVVGVGHTVRCWLRGPS